MVGIDRTRYNNFHRTILNHGPTAVVGTLSYFKRDILSENQPFTCSERNQNKTKHCTNFRES